MMMMIMVIIDNVNNNIDESDNDTVDNMLHGATPYLVPWRQGLWKRWFMTTNHFPFIMMMIMTNLEDQVLGVQGKAIELQFGWEDWLLRWDSSISIEISQSLKLGQSVHLGRRVGQHRFIVGFHRSCFNRRRRCLRGVLLATVVSFASSPTLLCDESISKFNVRFHCSTSGRTVAAHWSVNGFKLSKIGR